MKSKIKKNNKGKKPAVKKKTAKKVTSKKPAVKKKTVKKVTSKKVTSKKLTPDKKLKKKIYVKTGKGKQLVKIKKDNAVKKGYFNRQGSKYLLKSLEIAFPEVTREQIIERLGISKKTYEKILNQTEKTRFKKTTLKKLSKTLNGLAVEKQYLLAEISKHIKRYGGISDKKLSYLEKKVMIEKKFLDSLDDKEYLFFRALYNKITEMDFTE